MGIKTNKSYSEVSLDGMNSDRHYHNPKARRYQYEFALYEAVSSLFGSVRCRSMSMESLKLYFSELPEAKENSETPKRGTREDVLAGMTELVARDVAGKVTFPMMHICACETACIPEKDGSHTFIFSDGIFGFSVRLVLSKDGRPVKVKTKDFTQVRPVRDKGGKSEAKEDRAAHNAA
ncbi:MAG: hypothetical protein IKQ40_04765 [Lachnospiraceae bacterium]|nr:hypothetical protein [Lachnospiraceae bacterium]